MWGVFFNNSRRSDWLCKLTLYPFRFVPTYLCLLTAPCLSLCDTISLPLLYIFYSHYLCLSLSFLFLCHFPSASPCHYSAHMSRLKRQPLLPACVVSLRGSTSLTLTLWVCISAYVHACACARLCAHHKYDKSEFITPLKKIVPAKAERQSVLCLKSLKNKLMTHYKSVVAPQSGLQRPMVFVLLKAAIWQLFISRWKQKKLSCLFFSITEKAQTFTQTLKCCQKKNCVISSLMFYQLLK